MWSRRSGSAICSSPGTTKGIVTCLEASTGKIVWKERIGGEYFASPVCVGDRLYGISRDGRVVILAASRGLKS